jgi:hypothetical protein
MAITFPQKPSDQGRQLEPCIDLSSGYYLTDGDSLFRSLGRTPDSAGLVALEDCRSLEVILVTAAIIDALDPVAATPIDL